MEKISTPNAFNKSPEQTTNLEEKKWDLFNLQLDYAEKLISEEVKIGDSTIKGSLDSTLKLYSSIPHFINEEYGKRVNLDEFSNENYAKFEKGIIDQIVETYNKDRNNWKAPTRLIIENAVNNLGPIIKKDNESNHSDQEAGLIHFNITKCDVLKEFGIQDTDDCINIHFSNLVEQKQNNEDIKNLFSNGSLSKLATKIVNEFPETKAILGKSWIVSSPLGKRIGFSVAKTYKGVGNNSGFWGQFIDENGNLKKEKAQKFLQTGVPEFNVALGYIKVEDFLKKYLPQELKGKIELKDKNQEFIDFEREMEKTRLKIFDDSSNYTPEQVENILNGNKYLREFMKTSDGLKFLEFIQKAVKEKVNTDSNPIDGRDEVKKSMDDYFKYITDNKYTTREFVIE